MLDRLITIFWNGEKFVCRLDGTHEIVDTDSIAVYQPIILGKRLPKEIIDKIADAVGDTTKFLTPKGISSENMQSECYDVANGAFMLGTLLAPVQLMINVGLYNAGRKDVALKAIENWFTLAPEIGPQVIMPSPKQENPPPVPEGTKPVLSGGNSPIIPGGYCSWGAAVFMVLGSLLYEEEAKND
jgi:hypothetical protein